MYMYDEGEKIDFEFGVYVFVCVCIWCISGKKIEKERGERGNTAPMYWLYVCMYICDIDAVRYSYFVPL